MEQEKMLVTIKQAAEILGCSVTTVRSLRRRGMFDDCTVKGKTMLDKLDVENARKELNPNMLKPRKGSGRHKKSI